VRTPPAASRRRCSRRATRRVGRRRPPLPLRGLHARTHRPSGTRSGGDCDPRDHRRIIEQLTHTVFEKLHHNRGRHQLKRDENPLPSTEGLPNGIRKCLPGERTAHNCSALTPHIDEHRAEPPVMEKPMNGWHLTRFSTFRNHRMTRCVYSWCRGFESRPRYFGKVLVRA